MENNNQELIKVEEIKKIISTTPAVLAENEKSYLNCKKRYDELVALPDSQDTYKLRKEFIEKALKTVKSMNDKRSANTQIMDLVKKKFTSIEGGVKTDFIEPMQKKNDAYATLLYNEQQEKDRLAKLELDKQKEKADIIAAVEKEFNSQYAEFLSSIKIEINNRLNNATLETIDTIDIKSVKCDLPALKRTYAFQTKYHNGDELKAIVDSVTIPDYSEKLASELTPYKQEVIDKIPSKKIQLQEADEAVKKAEKAKKDAEIAAQKAKEAKDEAEKKAAQEALQAAENAKKEAEAEVIKIEKTEEVRAEQSVKDIQAETSSELAVMNENTDIQAAGEKIKAATIVQSDIFGGFSTIKTKKEYDVIVTDKAGYAVIFQFWFEKEGKDQTDEKIEKMTIRRMIEFAEKRAINDEKIVSNYVEYKQRIKSK